MAATHAFPTPQGLAAARPRPALSVSFPSSLCLFSGHRLPSPLRIAVSSRLRPSKPSFSSSSSSGANESVEDYSSDDGVELLHASPRQRQASKGAPVFVTLPLDAVGPSGQMTRKKTMEVSFLALAQAGVEGVVMECWWGIVEREAPEVYDWGGYIDLVVMAQRFGLKVRAIMAFHQQGRGPGDPAWIPLPQWVLEEMHTEPDLAFSDRFGTRNKEYISFGCDTLPFLRGRSPMQAYSDFMRSFKDTFRDFLGVVITEIQVGMGPAGELRYPSFPTEKLSEASATAQVGEFQCYDKNMLASLSACARKAGIHVGEHGDPLGAAISLQENPDNTAVSILTGSWNTSYGRFFLEWYSGLLLLHGERLCMVTDAVFRDTGVQISAKIGVIYWHHDTISHSSELTAGYYHTLLRDGYLPILRMFGRYGIALCCKCFDMRDADHARNPWSSPEGFLKQLLYTARVCNLPLIGENSFAKLDEASVNQVVKNSRFYYNGDHDAPLSFNYVRMGRTLYEPLNWSRFAKFVKRMSDSQTFRARLDNRRNESFLSSAYAAEEAGGRPLLCH